MKGKIYDIVGLGNALLDRIAEVDDAFLARLNIGKGHMALTDEEDMKTLQREIHLAQQSSGGALANCLVGAALLGSQTAFIGRVGDDAQGKDFIADLNKQKVAFAGSVAKDQATGVCLVLVTPDAQRSMRTALGASTGIVCDDIDEKLIVQAEILYLESYLWDSASACQAGMYAAKLAQQSNTQIALNLSDPLCVDRHRENLAAFVAEFVDILIGNEQEICAFHQVGTFDEAEKASAKLDLSFAALTRSEEGSVILDRGAPHFVAAVKNIKAIDTTGAGDLYAAGFLHCLARGDSAVEGGRLGAKIAAAVVQIHGARLPNNFSL